MLNVKKSSERFDKRHDTERVWQLSPSLLWNNAIELLFCLCDTLEALTVRLKIWFASQQLSVYAFYKVQLHRVSHVRRYRLSIFHMARLPHTPSTVVASRTDVSLLWVASKVRSNVSRISLPLLAEGVQNGFPLLLVKPGTLWTRYFKHSTNFCCWRSLTTLTTLWNIQRILAAEIVETKRLTHALFTTKAPVRLIVPRNWRGREAVSSASLRWFCRRSRVAP